MARKRSAEWTQSIAVGSEAYVASVQMELGIVARFRTIEDESDDAFVLRETTEPYQSDCRLESERLSPENTHSWKLSNWVATG